jgi:hypothetical protein
MRRVEDLRWEILPSRRRGTVHPLTAWAISGFQKLFLTSDPNQLLIPRHPVPREGALAIVTDVGAGSGGRGCCD